MGAIDLSKSIIYICDRELVETDDLLTENCKIIFSKGRACVSFNAAKAGKEEQELELEALSYFVGIARDED